MQIGQKFRNYRMRFYEKKGSSFYLPFKRALKIIFRYPKSITHHWTLEVMMGVTYRCQCNCVHCGISMYEKNSESELKTQEVENILIQITNLPYVFIKVSFFGGEPLLRKDIFYLINNASKMGIFTEINSNGILLSANNIRKLKESGLHHIYISLDNATSEMHNKLRGIDYCYQRVIEGIDNCIRIKLPYSISTYATRENLNNGNLIAIIEKAQELSAISVRILYPLSSGNLRYGEEKLSEADKRKLHSLLRPDFVYLETPDCCTNKSQMACGSLQRRFFYISPYGDMQLCPFVSLFFGNIRSEKLTSCLTKMWQNQIFNSCYGRCLAE